MAHATDIVGYQFQADTYCPDCIVSTVGEARSAFTGADLTPEYLASPGTHVEFQLDAMANKLGINRMDEHSYDSDQFPKVIFASQACDETHDLCGACGIDLSGCEPDEDPKFEDEPDYDEPAVVELADGTRIEARLKPDNDTGPPWENTDLHGPVSDWRRYSADGSTGYKAPGERVLYQDRGQARFYDVAAATKLARKDGWGCPHRLPETSYEVPPAEHKTRGEEVACAVQADFQRLEDWCNDRWRYVGVVLKVIRPDGFEKDYAASLWGIESDAGDYLTEVANELLSEAMAPA